MFRIKSMPFRRAGQPAGAPPADFAATGRGRLVLVVASVLLLTLSFAPIGQFYLAWVGLAPWLVVVARGERRYSWWCLLAGGLFFSINMWWMVLVTAPGAAGLMLYLGTWFVISAWILRGTGVWTTAYLDAAHPAAARRAVLAIVLVAAIWSAQEWLRGTLFTGLPWLFLGHTQTPVLALCQIADLTGAYGVTFWIVLINAWVALLILHRLNPNRLIPAGVIVVVIFTASLAYGIFRMSQAATFPGPTVLVVQPSYPQSNTGAKGATLDQIVDFHITHTRKALAEAAARKEHVDLVAWSETMMPELNEQFREVARGKALGKFEDFGAYLDRVHQQIRQIAADFHTTMVVGGVAMLPQRRPGEKWTWSRRNSAYLFDQQGRESPLRYDKIHLVPFGEFIPFRDTFPLLYRFFNLFNPYEGDYTVEAGEELTVFEIPRRAAAASAATAPAARRAEPTWRFITPICFEDIDAELVARMLRGVGGRRADFIINLTNDGWFRANEMPQHLQAGIFRSIENRAPTARAVNTGISGFIDSVGRTSKLVGAARTGTSIGQLMLDRRVTFYTRFGDVFAWLCVMVLVAGAGRGILRRMKIHGDEGR